MSPFLHEKRVEFCETDAAGIAHFSSLCQYIEQAEHAFLRSLGVSVFPPRHGSNHSDPSWRTWPRVRIEVDFKAPAHFEDKLTLKVQLAHMGTSSVTYLIEIWSDQTLIAIGKSTSVCCALQPIDGKQKLVKSPIDAELKDKLKLFLVAND